MTPTHNNSGFKNPGFIFLFLIESRLWIALGALMLTLETQIQLGQPPHLKPYLFILFFATLFKYHLYSLLSVIQCTLNKSPRPFSLSTVSANTFIIIIIIAITGLIVSMAEAQTSILIFFIPAAFITLFYTIPLPISSGISLQWRKIPFFKIFMIAASWSLFTVLPPWIRSHSHTQTLNSLYPLLADKFLFIFAITIPFDIRDMEYDRRCGLKTIPLLIGARGAQLLANSALILNMALQLTTPLFNFQTARISGIITIIITLFIMNFSRFKNKPFYCNGILDGLLILKGLLTLAAWIIFNRVLF